MCVGAIFIGFLQTCLTCAVIILVAWAIVWVLTNFMELTIDGNVMKWGKVVVGLLCLIAVVAWLFSVLGGGGCAATGHFLWRW